MDLDALLDRLAAVAPTDRFRLHRRAA